ncbi:hypothetical protein AYK24_06995 [Thermoplasmatales archaeon SG8-52-4]|nr:MAG: hypothetical protein AYK24_06995 [Thermoplasmatales archaeon SG8-52-4]
MVKKNHNIIYGIDINQKVTPVMVRDAIIQCFYEAHCNVLELAKESFGKPSKKRFEEMKKIHVKDLIYDIFIKIEGDYNNPTKEDLLKVIENLKKFASFYRKPDIINKHVKEISQLINKID